MVKLVYSSAGRNGSALQGLIPLVPDHLIKKKIFFMKKLLRREHGEIGGVCGGIADYFNIDETIIRLLFLVGIFTPFPVILTYILFWIVTPKEKII